MGWLAKQPRKAVWFGLLVVLGLVSTRPWTWAQATGQGGSTGGPKQVLIIRHAEKPGDPSDDGDKKNPNLSTRGRERAAALAYSIPATFPTPDFLFATKDTASSKRPVETITPLSHRLKLDIDQRYADKDYGTLAHEILNHPKYAGKRILICWHHGKLPDLAIALHAHVPKNKQKWNSKVFDRVWQIDYSGGGTNWTDLPQRLLYGDTEE